MADLDAVADTMEAYRAATDQLSAQVDALLDGSGSYGTVEKTAERAYERRTEAEAAAMGLLSGWAERRLEQAGNADRQPQPSLDDGAGDMVDYIDDTYLAAIDSYFEQVDRLESAGYDASPLLD